MQLQHVIHGKKIFQSKVFFLLLSLEISIKIWRCGQLAALQAPLHGMIYKFFFLHPSKKQNTPALHPTLLPQFD